MKVVDRVQVCFLGSKFIASFFEFRDACRRGRRFYLPHGWRDLNLIEFRKLGKSTRAGGHEGDRKEGNKRRRTKYSPRLLEPSHPRHRKTGSGSSMSAAVRRLGRWRRLRIIFKNTSNLA